MTSANAIKGLMAGFIATAALSVLMLLKQMMGLMPQLNPIEMLTTMVGASTPAIGWIMHFAIGAAMWGILFAWLEPQLPSYSHWLKGIIFGIGAWILMMVAVMSMAGAGLFGNLGMMAPVMTLMLHILYGGVLGGVYGLEHPEGAQSRRLSA